MTRLAVPLIVAALAGPAFAEDTSAATDPTTDPEACADLGLSNPYLTAHFCDRIAEITGGGTRSLGGDDDPGADAPDWMRIEALAEAHRVDPQKTLELIARIRNAGGLPPTN